MRGTDSELVTARQWAVMTEGSPRPEPSRRRSRPQEREVTVGPGRVPDREKHRVQGQG